jgi:D-3-phosphoglycerate dehydrogenase
MKIVVADDLPESALRDLREISSWTVDTRSGRSRSSLLESLANADALIVRSATRVDRELLDAAPHLRVIARAGTGVDNVDVEAASARGIIVMNAPGANSVSVAEHAWALILALARRTPSADAAMKAQRWEKKNLTGVELRGKVLGLIGLGRIGQEMALRGRAFGMTIVAHDPFISAQIAADAGVELAALDEVCARADYLSLHLPSTPATVHLISAERLRKCKRGVSIINTARGDLIDQVALAEAISSGQVAGAGLDVFAEEPPTDWQLALLPEVVATPHIAASTREAQELVGIEAASAVRDFLRDGIVRNAVNFPAVSPEEFRRLQPYLRLAERLGSMVAQLGEARTSAVGIRYYGGLASSPTELITAAVLLGVFRPMVSSGVTLVNARTLARERGVEVIESRSTRPRDFTSLLSVKLHTSEGERWVEGTVFETGSARLVLIDGVEVEAPLEGTLLVIHNNDQPGVIGAVGTLLGQHEVNIANFNLGRGDSGAIGVVNVDEDPDNAIKEDLLDEVRAIPAVRSCDLVRF